jgi:hypothetical protein
MADAIVQPGTNQAIARHGWFYIAKLAITAFGILLCLVTLKFLCEHKLASKNSGLEGAISQPRLDLLLIGSSHTRKSYDMRMLEKATGTSSLFLISYDGTDLSAISQMLDYMAARPDGCPKHVVIEAYGTLLGRKPDIEDPRYFSEAPPQLKVEIIRSYLSQHRYPSAFLDIFDLVVNRGNDEIVSHPLYAWAERIDTYKGGRAAFYFPGLTAEQFRQLKANYFGTTPNPAQVAALNHILDLAESYHIALVFVSTPMPEPSSSNPVIQPLNKDFKDIVTARGFPYIDGDQGFPINDPSLFSDNNHLSSKGRDEFTLRIAVEIKSWLAGERVGTP